MDIALDGLILAISWLHTSLAPYAKVEESFNLHAIHDVLMYGVGRDNLLQVSEFRLKYLLMYGLKADCLVRPFCISWRGAEDIRRERFYCMGRYSHPSTRAELWLATEQI